jgi:L-fuconolactonase
MKLDAHQHFWIFNDHEYGWINDRMEVLKRDYLPRDLYQELIASGIFGSVAVQARQSINETRWLLKLAEDNDFIKGVVGWVDLCSPELKTQLEEFTRYPKFKGVRHVIHDEPDDNFLLRDDFLSGIALIGNYNLTYDLLLFPKHLRVAEKMVSMFPHQRFILDHISKPLIRSQVVNPWKEDILRIAEYKNVWCKLSGMVTEADINNQKQEDFNPYLDVVFKAFGTNRIMFGSDWPVCRLAGSYQHVLQIVENYISLLPAMEKTKIMGNNCKDAYCLNLSE